MKTEKPKKEGNSIVKKSEVLVPTDYENTDFPIVGIGSSAGGLM